MPRRKSCSSCSRKNVRTAEVRPPGRPGQGSAPEPTRPDDCSSRTTPADFRKEPKVCGSLSAAILDTSVASRSCIPCGNRRLRGHVHALMSNPTNVQMRLENVTLGGWMYSNALDIEFAPFPIHTFQMRGDFIPEVIVPSHGKVEVSLHFQDYDVLHGELNRFRLHRNIAGEKQERYRLRKLDKLICVRTPPAGFGRQGMSPNCPIEMQR